MPDDYKYTVATILGISLQTIKKELLEKRSFDPSIGIAVGGFFNLCAFMPPENFPRSLLSSNAEDLPEPLASCIKDARTFDDIIASLNRYSLIKANESLLSIHKLVQTVIKYNLPNEDMNKWSRAAINIFTKAFEDADPNCISIYLHQVKLAIHDSEYLLMTLRDLLELGTSFKERRKYKAAKNCLELGLSTINAKKQPDFDQTKIRLNISDDEPYELDPIKLLLTRNLGYVLLELGDLKGSKERFDEAMPYEIKTHGQDDPRIAENIRNVGLIFYKQGELNEAKRCFERALKIDEKSLKPKHLIVATDVNNLGLVLRDLGEMEMAKSCFERSKKMQNLQVDGHPLTEEIKANLSAFIS
jgi:tetratricopeptide (TPR) repeat protein